jgi:hypothetical protein
VLTCYAAQADAFDDGGPEHAELLAELAAVAVAAQLGQERAENLEVALAPSRTIGTAIGILTERLRTPPGQAFQNLRHASSIHQPQALRGHR